jgi:hypothetical protein
MSRSPSIVMISSALAALVAAAGCADDIEPAREPDRGAPDPASPVGTVRNADGTYTTTVDATSSTAWTWIDLDAGGAVAEDGPWDVGAQRFHLRVNGAAGVEIAIATGDFAAITAMPAAGWRSDVPDRDGDGVDELAFEQDGGWYDYDPASHVLTPRPLVWAIKTGGGHAIKLAIESYYDGVGTAGHFTLRWAPLSTGGAP